MEPRKPSEMDDFLFDLRGYLILEQAVEPALIDELNAAFDNFPELGRGEWWGNAQRRDYTGETGFELHNCVEVGEPFEKLIDHPGWIDLIRHYCGRALKSRGYSLRAVTKTCRDHRVKWYRLQ